MSLAKFAHPYEYDIGDHVVFDGAFRGRITRYHDSQGKEPQYGVRICVRDGYQQISAFESELEIAQPLKTYHVPALYRFGGFRLTGEVSEDVA